MNTSQQIELAYVYIHLKIARIANDVFIVFIVVIVVIVVIITNMYISIYVDPMHLTRPILYKETTKRTQKASWRVPMNWGSVIKFF